LLAGQQKFGHVRKSPKSQPECDDQRRLLADELKMQGMPGHTQRAVIGITADANADKFQVGRAYIEMVERAGGAPLILPCIPACAEQFVRLCDGIILSGGGDPITTDPRLGGVPVHPQANPIDPARQEFELAILDALQAHRDKPALGICLGMQMMGLHAGGTIDQRLADSLSSADQHWDTRAHEVTGELGRGVVHSHHRQALTDAGALRVIASAHDGVIEAIAGDDRPFYIGVQWHPERTSDPHLGLGLIRRLVDAALMQRS
jgi:putative glutamine amidotransferase